MATPIDEGTARAASLATPACVNAMQGSSARWCLLEVGCGSRHSFEHSHIPGAAYLDTSELERPPLWNKIDDGQLLALLLARGIDAATTVILYGRTMLPPARAAHLLLYAGVRDVRLLDGGFAAWCAAGGALAHGAGSAAVPVGQFGAPFPARSDWLASLGQIRRIVNEGGATLASIRTRAEFQGEVSGYSYIAARGDIPGARWGRAGADGDVNSMCDYQDAGGALLPAAAIAAMWRAEGIVADGPVVFYCGTGWRASLAFFCACAMGWDQIALFDGGWLEWSRAAALADTARRSRARPASAAAISQKLAGSGTVPLSVCRP